MRRPNKTQGPHIPVKSVLAKTAYIVMLTVRTIVISAVTKTMFSLYYAVIKAKMYAQQIVKTPSIK